MNAIAAALLLLGQFSSCPGGRCPQPTYERPPTSRVIGPALSRVEGPVADPYSRVVVRIANEKGNSTSYGSGVILTRTGLVLTCKHIFRGGVGKLTVHRGDGKSWEARLVAIDKQDDLSAIAISDPGPIPPILFSSKQPRRAILIGFPGGQDLPESKSGYETRSVAYGFNAVNGDSGGPIFVQGPVQGAGGATLEPGTLGLAGVLWGSNGSESYATSGEDVRRFLSERCIRFFSRGPYINVNSPGQPVAQPQPLPMPLDPIALPLPVTPTPVPVPIAPPVVVDLGPLTARVAALESAMGDVGKTLTNLSNITSAHSATLAKGIAFSVAGPRGVITSPPAHLGDSVDLNPFFVPSSTSTPPAPPTPAR